MGTMGTEGRGGGGLLESVSYGLRPTSSSSAVLDAQPPMGTG